MFKHKNTEGDSPIREKTSPFPRDPVVPSQKIRLDPSGAYINSLQSPYLRRYDWIPIGFINQKQEDLITRAQHVGQLPRRTAPTRPRATRGQELHPLARRDRPGSAQAAFPSACPPCWGGAGRFGDRAVPRFHPVKSPPTAAGGFFTKRLNWTEIRSSNTPWDWHICRSIGVVPGGSMVRHIWHTWSVWEGVLVG